MAIDREGRPEVKPVIDLKTKETSLPRRIFKQLIKSDLKSLKQWIILDVMVPGFQDAFINAITMIFYGNDYTKSKSVERSTIGKGTSKIHYNKAYRGNLSTGRREERAPEEVDGYIPDYRNELVCENERDAIRVLESMQNIIADYDDATVVQLYQLCNITHPDFQMNNWGWDKEAFKGATYRRVRDGWVLMIPEAIYLSE